MTDKTREITQRLRVVIADDERPARSFLANLLRECEDVDLVGEAANGSEAVQMIEQTKPDLALLDLEMPEVDGLGVVRLIRRNVAPLFAFVTAYDAYAVQAFEANAIDYLLKPIELIRLRHTLMRAHERLERHDFRVAENERLQVVAADVERVLATSGYLRRIPVRKRDDIVIVPVDDVVAIIADGELLQLVTVSGERHVITYRLKDIEARLDPEKFVRLSRGVLARVDHILKISPMPGGTYMVTLRNRLQLPVSRIRAKALREDLLRL